MKKIILLAIVTMMTISNMVIAQTVDLGDNFATIGVGPAMNYTPTLITAGFAPGIRLTYEVGKFEISPGVVTLGAMVGFSNVSGTAQTYYWWNPYTRSYTVNTNYLHMVAAVRSAWYYNCGQIGVRELNLYGGVALGLRFNLVNETVSGDVPPTYVKTKSKAAPHVSSFLGANYQFSKDWACFLEFGYDISFMTGGLVYRFN